MAKQALIMGCKIIVEVVNFSILWIQIVLHRCHVVAMCDLVHNVEKLFHI